MVYQMFLQIWCISTNTIMRDKRSLEEFRKSIERKLREMNIFINLKKEVEIGANGTQKYVIKKGTNKGKIAK